jgi:CRP/FNR family transcriptional regulator, anaerobic regulatory protein
MKSSSGPLARTLESLVPGLGTLPAGLASVVETGALVIERAAGSPLFDDGNPCAGMLVLERGCVRVSLTSASGRSLVLYRVHPGETCVLTLSCLLGHEPYPARGEAESDVRGVFLPPELFDRLVWEAPAFREFVFTAFATRLRGALDVACAVAFERLDRRLAAALLERVERDRTLDIPVTHQQLADELGCTREAVSRLLESLVGSGALSLGRGHVRVSDKLALARLARAAD